MKLASLVIVVLAAGAMCVCPAGQTCQAPWSAEWFCSVDAG